MEETEVVLRRLSKENPVLYNQVMGLREQHACVMVLPRDTAIKVAELALVGLIIDGEARKVEKPWDE